MSPMRLWFYWALTCWLPESRFFWLKCALLRWAGARIGNHVRIYSSAKIIGNGSLEIGNDVHIGPQALISTVTPAKVTISSHVDIGPRVTVLTGSHQVNFSGEHVAGKGVAADVTIGDGTWICANASILPGVSLSQKTLVAAGAVVTQSIATPSSLIVGVPAKIKELSRGKDLAS